MDANDLIGLASKSRFLRAIDVPESGQRYTIANVSVESMKSEGGDDRDKGVVWLDEDPRGLVLNVTLTVILRDLFGVDLEGWHGKRVTLYNDTSVRRGPKVVGGIRIKGSPDIAKTVKITAGKSAFSRGTEYTITAERDQDPIGEALAAAGLTVAAFDSWAVAVGKPPAAKMSRLVAEKCAAWLRGTGHETVHAHAARATGGADPTDPMAV